MPRNVELPEEIKEKIDNLDLTDYVKELVRYRCTKRVSLDAAIAQSVAIESSKERLLGIKICKIPNHELQERRKLLNRKTPEEYKETYDQATKKLNPHSHEFNVWKHWWNNVMYIETYIVKSPRFNDKNTTTTLRSDLLPTEW